MNQQDLSPYLATIKAEHRELQQLVGRIRKCLAAPVSEATLPQAREDAVDLLLALARHLRQHFAQEEAGGYQEEVLSIAPRFSHEAGVLVRQHAAFLANTDELLRACRDCVSMGDWAALCNRLKQVLHDLLAHEAAENRIVQQAFNTDLGLND